MATTVEGTAPRLASYTGLCSICGERGEFRFGNERSVREDYRCPHCRFALRWRDQASLMIDEFGNGQTLSLADLVSGGFLDDVAIFEPALRGPFAKHLRKLPKYTRSYFWPDRRLGSIGEEGVQNEDLTNLTFADDSFDLVITSDVMEHLFDIDAAFGEINRVLKPGGVHIFSIPTAYPLPDETVARVARKDGEEVNVLPAIYHNAGDGTPCLVYHDYGADLPARIDRHGSRTRIVRRSAGVEPCERNATFITRKVAPAAAPVPPQGVAEPETECPICGSHEFEDFNGRRNARCSRCRCVERQRLMWMVLQHFDLLREGLRVLHIAPAKVLSRNFQKILGDTYTQYEPAGRQGAGSRDGGADLVTDLAGFADNSFDVIIHNHVLDGLTSDVGGALRQMTRILTDGGHHLLSEPIRGEILVKAAANESADAQQRSRPGIPELLDDAWGGDRSYFLDPLTLFDEQELRRRCIPQSAWTGIPNSQGVFYNRAPTVGPARAPAPPKAEVRPATPAPALAEAPAADRVMTTSTLTTDIETGRLTRRREQTGAWILRQFAPAAHYRRLVDLGAGPCVFSKIAASLGHAVTAVDARVVRRPDDLGGIAFRQEDVRQTDLSTFDVVMILGKGKQELDGLRVEIEGTRADATPAVFTDITLTFIARGDVALAKLERAVQLSVDKYCSVARMLRDEVRIEHRCRVE